MGRIGFKGYLLICALLTVCLGGLSACGVKPGYLEPPTNEGQSFPRTYPDPSTDPQK